MTEKLPAVRPDQAGSEYAMITADPAEVRELFEANLGAGGASDISANTLPRIQLGAGGATVFTIQTLDGEEHEKEVEGIVLAWTPGRVYWKLDRDEGGSNRPPDCTSVDGFHGVGNPGGRCAECPFKQFGTASKGHGQACKQIRRILFVRPGELLPYLITVPPTSLKAAGKYFQMLLSRQIPHYAATTKLRLERATNDAGKPYAKMQFFLGRRLEPAEAAAVKPFHQQMKALLAPMAIDHHDYVVVDERPPVAEYHAEPGPELSPPGDEVPF